MREIRDRAFCSVERIDKIRLQIADDTQPDNKEAMKHLDAIADQVQTIAELIKTLAEEFKYVKK